MSGSDSSIFDSAFAEVVGIEGRYSNDPSDSGGETMFGITERVARANGYSGPMAQMPLEAAKRVYREQYWDLMRLDQVAQLAGDVAARLFNAAVNCGVGRAGQWLQRALNVFNLRGAYYPDIAVDGVIGPGTIAALRAYMARRGATGSRVLLEALRDLQGAFYIGDAEARDKDEDFVYGWIKNRVLEATA